MLPTLGSEPWHSDLAVLHATPELIPSFDPKHFLSPRINKAWLHNDLKGWDFQQIGELAQG